MRTLIPNDWVRLEQLINELFGRTMPTVSDALSTEISDRASDIKYLSDSFVTVSNALSTEISDRDSAIKYLSDALSSEISDRQSAVKFLSDAVSDVQVELDAVSDAIAAGDYLLLDGTRVMTGPVVFGAAPVDTNGNWKIEHDGTDLLVKVRIGGIWGTKWKFEAT